MYDGTLGVYPHKKFHIDVDPNAEPVYLWPYYVCRIHSSTFKKELDYLVDLGVVVFTKTKMSGVHLPLLYPKRMYKFYLSQQNKVIKLKEYPLPIITEILRKHIWYKFFTKTDMSMQYFTFEFDKESQDLCTIYTPLEFTNTIDFQWDSNYLLNNTKHQWKMFFV